MIIRTIVGRGDIMAWKLKVQSVQGVTALFVMIFVGTAFISALLGHLVLSAIAGVWSAVGCVAVYWEDIMLAVDEDNNDLL